MIRRPRVAIVGHVEWATHARGTFPAPGEITSLDDAFDEPAGGGAVAAAQAAALGAETLFFTAVGNDEASTRALTMLNARGIEVRAARRDLPLTRALSVTGVVGDRAIALTGVPMGPELSDALGWEDVAAMDAVYFTGRDPASLVACRVARTLVATARRWPVIARSGVDIDVLVASANDPDEQIPDDVLGHQIRALARTRGAAGGDIFEGARRTGAWGAAPRPGPEVDSYGCGDVFAAGLTVALARGDELVDAVALGARCGAQMITERGGLRGLYGL